MELMDDRYFKGLKFRFKLCVLFARIGNLLKCHLVCVLAWCMWSWIYAGWNGCSRWNSVEKERVDIDELVVEDDDVGGDVDGDLGSEYVDMWKKMTDEPVSVGGVEGEG